MKIALYHNLPSGGARRAVFEMVKGLVGRGHVVDEYCPASADLSFLPLDRYVRRQVVLPFQPKGVATRRIPLLTPYLSAIRLTADLLNMAQTGRQAAEAIDGSDADLAFTHDCQLSQNPDILGYLNRPAAHYCHHGSSVLLPLPADATRDRLRERVKRAYYAPARWFYPWLAARRGAYNIRQADVVLTNSCFAREGLYRVYGIESQVCYLGVDTELFRPLSLEQEPFVLSVGAIHYHKGYRFLVRALGRLPVEARPLLVIAANSVEPQERQVVETLAGQLGVDLRITRITDDEKLVRLYNQAAAFVYTPIMEPWGLTAVEAMACGTPVVAVREGGVRESVADGVTGLLVKRDEDAFTGALARVLTDPALARKLGAAGAARVREHFTWGRCVDYLEQVFTCVSQRGMAQ